MTTLYVAIGVPGSGKDWYGENHLPDIVHVSSDAIREEMFGDAEDQTHNDMVFNEMLNRTIKALNNNQSVYYNSTNINQKRRIKLLNAIQDRVHTNFETIALVFAVPINTCIKRNSSRKRTVPYYVIDRMYKSFQVPAYCEGWSLISFIHDGDNHVDRNKTLEKLRTIPHDNPHHTLTIGDHMMSAGSYALEKKFPIEVVSAAFYHDIGKLQTKVFTDSKGRPSVDAHYYGHASVGAYDFITGVDANIYTIEIANLIQLHMSFYEGENRLKNIKKLYGDEFFEKLEMLHEADEAAH